MLADARLPMLSADGMRRPRQGSGLVAQRRVDQCDGGVYTVLAYPLQPLLANNRCSQNRTNGGWAAGKQGSFWGDIRNGNGSGAAPRRRA